MKSVYVNAPGENWIVDRLAKEWREHNQDISTTEIREADVVWLLSDWTWQREQPHINKQKHKVVTTIHHIVPWKFNASSFEKQNFYLRDDITDLYHVPNQHTKNFVSEHTTKPIVVIPYWANDMLWTKTKLTSCELRAKYSIDENAFVVGSFQRDSEGNSILSGNPQPKKEKGPEEFVAYVEKLACSQPNLLVLLAGWRRQFVVQELSKRNIKFLDFSREGMIHPIEGGYIKICEGDPKHSVFKNWSKPTHLNESEMVSEDVLCELYQCCDLYPVTALVEGGPQSFLECGLLGVKVVCRDVGIARAVMHDCSFMEGISDPIPTVPMVEKLKISQGWFNEYRKMFENL